MDGWSLGGVPVVIVVLLLLILLLWDSLFYPLLLRVFYPMSSQYLHRRIVLVTGAGRQQGIGYHLAKSFLEQGCHVILWDIDSEALVKAKASLIAHENAKIYSGSSNSSNSSDSSDSSDSSAAGRITTQIVDVSDFNAVKSSANTLVKNNLLVSILVHNAGVVRGKNLLDLTSNDIDMTFGVNVLAQYYSLLCFLPGMIQRNDGMVVTMSSIMGFMGGKKF